MPVVEKNKWKEGPIADMTTHSPAGMAHMAGLIEGGMSHRDAVAQAAQWKMGQGFSWLTRLVSQFHPQEPASDPSVFHQTRTPWGFQFWCKLYIWIAI